MIPVHKAAGQFVSKSKGEIIDMVKETLEGHQRAIMAELTVDEIYKDRLMFQRKVRETADVDLAKMGLRVISYTLKDVSDANGYMMSLGVRRIEEVKKEARMGEAQEKSEADQRCANFKAQTVQVVKKCESEIASAEKNFTMRQQEWKNEVAEAQQEAVMATALELQVQEKRIAELSGAVDATRVKWQTEIDKLEKERKEKDLEASQNLKAKYSKDRANLIAEAQTQASIAVAEANSKMVTSVAQAEADVIARQGEAAAEVMEAQADAWGQYGPKAYVDMITEKLPEIAAGLVTPLNKIDKMVLINVSSVLGSHYCCLVDRRSTCLPLTLTLTVDVCLLLLRRATATSARPRSRPRLLTSCPRSLTWSSRSPVWTSSPCSRASRGTKEVCWRCWRRRRSAGLCVTATRGGCPTQMNGPFACQPASRHISLPEMRSYIVQYTCPPTAAPRSRSQEWDRGRLIPPSLPWDGAATCREFGLATICTNTSSSNTDYQMTMSCAYNYAIYIHCQSSQGYMYGIS